MAVLTPSPKMQFESAAGVPLSGGKVYTYTAGTTTPLATFTDYTGATPNSNPIILNSRGEASIWLGAATYKFKLTDANDVEIWTVDYISAPTSGVSPILSGNVTIDSDTPGPALKITQTGTGPVMRVQDSADPDATPFIIDSAGQVGIGTATPSAQLEATGAARIGSLTLTTAPLPVASGGTNATTAAAARTSLGLGTADNVTFNGVSDAIGQLRDIPVNSQTTGYVLVSTDQGKFVSITTGGVTVPQNVFTVGDVVSIYNDSGSNQTITQGTGVTLRFVGTTTTGNRTLRAYGLCSVLCVATNVFVISGGGLA
jgi:hypothetical protein